MTDSLSLTVQAGIGVILAQTRIMVYDRSTLREQTHIKRRYDPREGRRGPVIQLPPEKVRITIRLDRDIVDHFRDLVRKAHRGNYQTLINDALRERLRKPSVAEPVGAEVRAGLREE
jgi:uncharacterized protein (DUF4415 family)